MNGGKMLFLHHSFSQQGFRYRQNFVMNRASSFSISGSDCQIPFFWENGTSFWKKKGSSSSPWENGGREGGRGAPGRKVLFPFSSLLLQSIKTKGKKSFFLFFLLSISREKKADKLCVSSPPYPSPCQQKRRRGGIGAGGGQKEKSSRNPCYTAELFFPPSKQ